MTTAFTRAHSLAGLAVLVLACDGQTPVDHDENAWLDSPPKVPAGRVVPESEREPELPDGSDCGVLSGRLADGSCRLLATMDAGYVERVLLPSGRFVMGRVPLVYDGRPGLATGAPRWPNQPPRFEDVASVWIDLVEVTREAYAQCVAEGRCTDARCLDGGDGRREGTDIEGLPQTCVTHEQAEMFCAARDGRLPTSIEWEYAARGVDSRVFPWGNQIRDEVTDVVMPISMRIDTSYFGILGLGSNANEWVADRYRPDVGLRQFADDFRDPAGPMVRARQERELDLACGQQRDKCALTEEDTERFVVRGPSAVGLRAARNRRPRNTVPETTLEGWKEVVQHPQLGFRCAADRRDEDPQYMVPSLPPPIPWIARTNAGLEIFGGIAEVVSRSEAHSFCAALHEPSAEPGAWRLPTRAEIETSATLFRGPGPFWTADGALVEASGTWSAHEAADDAPLLARCVRG